MKILIKSVFKIYLTPIKYITLNFGAMLIFQFLINYKYTIHMKNSICIKMIDIGRDIH